MSGHCQKCGEVAHCECSHVVLVPSQSGLGGIADALRNWADVRGVPIGRALATLAEEMVPGVLVLAPVPAEGHKNDV